MALAPFTSVSAAFANFCLTPARLWVTLKFKEQIPDLYKEEQRDGGTVSQRNR